LSYQIIEMEIIFGALDLGIIPPAIGIDIEAALAGMNAKDARAARRKFRKIKRKCSEAGVPLWTHVRDHGKKIMHNTQ
jgi:hypothetical protein